MMIRRQMLQGKTPLYPVGTDIIGKYIGRDESGRAYLNAGYMISTVNGEYTTAPSTMGRAASEVYMRVDPSYRYRKSKDGRVYGICYYDIDLNFIGNTPNYNSLTDVDLPELPAGAAYARFTTNNSRNNWGVKITRIA